MHKCLVETFRYQIWITKGGNSILVIGIELYFLSSQLTTLSIVLLIPSQFSILLKQLSLQKPHLTVALKTFIGFS